MFYNIITYFFFTKHTVLGASAYTRQAYICSVVYVHLFACISAAPTEWISAKFGTRGTFMKICCENSNFAKIRQFAFRPE